MIVSGENIFGKLKNQDVNKNAGSDDIPLVLLRTCCYAFTKPLLILFNKSLSSSNFPFEWKKGLITSIHKDDGKRNVVNYRTVTILSIIPMVFESSLFNSLYNSVSNYIIQKQHGFVLGRSPVTNLGIFTVES